MILLNNYTLKDLNIGESGRVIGLLNDVTMRRRLQDMGLVDGTRVECVLKSPAGDPSAYLIRGATVALRNIDAEKVLVSLGSDS